MKSLGPKHPVAELEVDVNSMGDVRFTTNFGLTFTLDAMGLYSLFHGQTLGMVRFSLESPAKKHWPRLAERKRLLVTNYQAYGVGVGELRSFWPGSESIKYKVNPQGALSHDTPRIIGLREEVRSGFIPVIPKGALGELQNLIPHWVHIYLDNPAADKVAVMLFSVCEDAIAWLPQSGFSFMTHSIAPSPLPYYFSPKPEGRKAFKHALSQFNGILGENL